MAIVTFMAVVILEPKKKKKKEKQSATISTVFPSICHEVMGQDAICFPNAEL